MIAKTATPAGKYTEAFLHFATFLLAGLNVFDFVPLNIVTWIIDASFDAAKF